MKFPPPDFRYLSFRTDEYPEHRRREVWCEVVSQMLLKQEVEALSDEPFRAEASLRALAGIRFGTGLITPTVNRRTREITAADNDDLFLIVNTEGPLSIVLPGSELAIREGDGCLLSCQQEMSMVRHSAGRVLIARFDRSILAALVPDLNAFLGRVILRGNEALWLLTSYLVALDGKQSLNTEGLRALVVGQIFDLIAETLLSSRTDDGVKRDDVRATARLRAIHEYIADHLGDQDLAIANVARANQLSARQLQRLFEASGTTLSEFVLLKRLQRVHAMLTQPGNNHRGISDIALECGFGDVSHFNRAFRRHYGIAPSAVRKGASVPG
jgi:AraC-like DNA-binding protein